VKSISIKSKFTHERNARSFLSLKTQRVQAGRKGKHVFLNILLFAPFFYPLRLCVNIFSSDRGASQLE